MNFRLCCSHFCRPWYLKVKKLKYVPYPYKDVGDMPIEDMHPEPRDIAVGWPAPFCPALTSQR